MRLEASHHPGNRGSVLVRLVVLAILFAGLYWIGRDLANRYCLNRGGKILRQNLAREKDHTPSLYWLRLAEACDPTTPVLHLYLGLYYTKSGEPAKAAVEFKRFSQLAPQDLGYFFRVFFSMEATARARTPSETAPMLLAGITAGTSPNGTAVPVPISDASPTTDPAVEKKPHLVVDLAANQVAPTTALLFAWLGIHHLDKGLVEQALERARPLDGRSFVFHLVKGIWLLTNGDRRTAITQLEHALEIHNAGGEPSASGIGILPFGFHLVEQGANVVPGLSVWIGQIVTQPDYANLCTAQLLYCLSVLSHVQTEYQRSVQWAELAHRRFGGELRRLGLEVELERYVYPLNYLNVVGRAAQKYKLDPFLVLGLMREESHFNPGAVSHVGARGLMQIMPKTGAWIAGELKWAGFTDEILANPADNIEFGSFYLANLIQNLGDSPDALPWVLAAYNGGIGNVRRWMERAARAGRTGQPNPADIEFKETRDYIVKVGESYRQYRRLYGDQLQQLLQGAGVDVEEPSPAPEAAPPPEPTRPVRRSRNGRHSRGGR